jgi:hypothetical protein
MSPRAKATPEPASPVVSQPRQPVASLPVGSHVQVTKGAWAGVVGVVDKLTLSAGGDRTTIVHADLPPEGEKEMRYLPRTRLLVVENQHIAPAPARARSTSEVAQNEEKISA